MKSALLLILLLFMQGACQPSTSPAPYVPRFTDIVGEWAVHHITYSGFEVPLDDRNRTDSSAALIGSDTYVFKPDSSYREQFAGTDFYSLDSSTLNVGTETGHWNVLAGQPSLRLNRDVPAYSAITEPYSATLTQANEFKTVYYYHYVLSKSGIVHRYTQEIYYRKKR